MKSDDPIFMGDVEDYLEHYGVKGMQWGKRRSRAALAKAAAKRAEKNTPEQQAARAADRAKVQERKAISNSRRLLDDKDLDKIVERMSKEKKLKDLVAAEQSAGAKFAKDVGSAAGNKLVRNLAVGGAAIASTIIGAKLESKFKLSEKVGVDPSKIISLISKAGKD